MGENARFKNVHARVETRVLKTLVCRKNAVGFFIITLVDSVSVSFKNASVSEKFLYSGMREPLACRSAC